MEPTKKELIWKELRKIKKKSHINMVQISRNAKCSLAYVSATMRYAFEAGFLIFDDTGNYTIQDIPKYEIFQEAINAKYSSYRNSTKSSSTRNSGSRKKVPQDFKFKANEENILAVIKALINSKAEMVNKYNKLLRYTKLIKQERDELLESLSEMEV